MPEFKPKYDALVTRLAPTRFAGYVTNITMQETTSLEDIVKQIGSVFGGGHYEIRYIDIDTARHCSTQYFDILGQPLITRIPCNCPTKKLMVRGCNTPYHL